jgi:hypothetical protein
VTSITGRDRLGRNARDIDATVAMLRDMKVAVIVLDRAMTDLSKIRRRGFGKPPTEASGNLDAPEVAPAAPERTDGPPWAGANPRVKVQFAR